MDLREVAYVVEEGQGRRTPTTIEELSVSVDQRFEAVDRRFEAVDRRFDAVDRQFEAVGAAIIEQRQYTEFAFGQLEQELVVVKSGLGRIERKLDRLIDAAFPPENPQPE